MVSPPMRSLTSTPIRSLTPTPLSLAPSPFQENDEVEEFPALLETLFAGSPTTLPERERKMLHEKVLKSVPAITPLQKREIVEIVRRLLQEKSLGKREAKEAVVAFMMRERGVAGWAGAVRRGVECVVLA